MTKLIGWAVAIAVAVPLLAGVPLPETLEAHTIGRFIGDVIDYWQAALAAMGR